MVLVELAIKQTVLTAESLQSLSLFTSRLLRTTLFTFQSNTTPAYLTTLCTFLLHQHPGAGLGMLQFAIPHFQTPRHLGKRERRIHAHGWHQSARAQFPGTRFRPNFRLPRIPTNQIRILLARAELHARADRRLLGVYKGSRVAR